MKGRLIGPKEQPNRSKGKRALVIIVAWKGIHSRSDTNRTRAKGLSFYYPRLLYCPDQMLTVMVLS